jgi:hypothetical protein
MGISGIGGVHASGNIKSVSRVDQVGLSEPGDTQAAVTRAHGPKRDTFRSDFSSLVKAVRGGDISSAQSALSALESDVTSTAATYNPASTSPAAAAPVASASQNDLDALFQAVRGGDIAGAQAALGQLQLDVRSTVPHGDHASLQGQIHGRGHGRGHGHQGSNLWTAVGAAFQSQTTTSVQLTTPAADPVADPAPTAEVPVPVIPETVEPLPPAE